MWQSREEQPSHTEIHKSVNQVWVGVPLCHPSNRLTGDSFKFRSKEIINLILFSCPHISSEQGRFREYSSPKTRRESDEPGCCCEGWDCQLQPAMWSFVPHSDDRSSCGSKPLSAQRWFVMDDLSGAVPAPVSVPLLQISVKLTVSAELLLSSPHPCCVPSTLQWSSACAARAGCQRNRLAGTK